MNELLENCGHNCESCNYTLNCEYYGDIYETAETGTAPYDLNESQYIKIIDTQAKKKLSKKNFETENG